MRREYFIYDEGKMYRVEHHDYLAHVCRLKTQEPNECETSIRDFGNCVVVFFYYCDELECMEIHYSDPSLPDGKQIDSEVLYSERV